MTSTRANGRVPLARPAPRRYRLAATGLWAFRRRQCAPLRSLAETQRLTSRSANGRSPGVGRPSLPPGRVAEQFFS